MTTGQGTIRYERRGHVGVVTIDRPARRNALDETMWRALEGAIDAVEQAPPRAIVLTGEADAFTAGMDVNPDNPLVQGVIAAVQQKDPAPVAAMMKRIVDVLERFFALPMPIIAAVNGLAYGGGAEIATRCDLRVADPRAVICFSEVRLGLMPDWGGGVALTRLLGPAKAAELILTARRVGAIEAHALGLVNRVSAEGQSVHEAMALAETIAKNGPRAVRAALSVIRTSGDYPRAEAMARELDAAVALIADGECVHGITAFLARKEPEFPG